MAQRIDKLNVQGNIVIGKNGYQDSTDKVQMHSSSTESILHITTSSTGSATSDGLRLGVVGSSAYFLLRENANMLFHTNNTERMRIDNTGNVGIGISSPAYRLDVTGTMRIAGNEDATNLRLAANLATVSGSAYQNYNELLFENTGATYGNAGIRHLGNAWLDSKSALAFFTSSNTGSFDERMRINESGNVGIGTTSPNAQLHVYSTGNGELEVERASGALFNVQAQSSLATIGTDSNHPLYLKTNAGTRVAITTGGNVGIGTTSPSYKLDVSGSSRIDGHIYTTGNLQSTTADPFPLLRGFTSSPNPENGIGSSYNVGLDENFFAGADINYTITATQNGSPISVGSNVFRATSNYWSLSVATNDTVVITITGFSFTHTCDFGLSFSTDGWRAKDITIERTTDGGTTWTLVDSVSNYSYNTYKVYSNTGSTATDGIRYTLTNFNTTAIRLSNIFASRYTGGSSYFLERYGDGTLFGKLTASFKGSVYGLKLERSDAAGSSLMEFANSSGVQNIIGYDAGVDAFKIGTSTATNLVLKGNGRLGIGTTAPDATLHVESTGVTAGGYKYHMIVDDNNAYGINEGGGIIFRGDYNSATAKANFGAIRAGKANANDGNANAYLSLMYGASGTLTEGFRLNWDGKVGIGTTSPNTKLQVNVASTADYVINANDRLKVKGDGTLWWGAAADYGKLTWDTGKAVIRGESGKALSLGANGSQDTIYINTSQNVGIGTTSPDQKLHVSGNVKATSSRMNYLAKDLTIEGTPQGGTNKGYVLLAKAYTTGFVDASYAIGKVYLRRGTVGTGHNLDVYEVLSSTGYNGDRFIVNLIEGNATRFSQLCKVTYGGVVYHAIETVSSGGEPSTEASFVGIAYDAKLLMTDETFVSSVTAYGTTGTWLDTSGNLGVGTTNPNAKLHVTDSIQVDGGDTFGVDNAGHQIYMSSGGTGLGGEFGSGYARNLIRSDGAATIHIGDNTSLISQIKLDAGSSGTNGYITFLTKQAERMRINENGNVGIGTTSPSYKLHVEGDSVYVTGGTSNGKWMRMYVNDSWAYLTTNGGKYYFNAELRIDGGLIGSYNEDLQLRTGSTTRITISDTDGSVQLHNYGAGYLKTDASGNVTAGSIDVFGGDAAGLVPAGDSYDATYYLDGDGGWSIPPDNNTVTSVGITGDHSTGTITLVAGGATNINKSGGTITIDSTDSQYTAGAGLDLTSGTFSVEPDLRDGITHIGRDTDDFLAINPTNFAFYLDGFLDMRLSNSGTLDVDGDVVAYSTVTNSDRRLKTDISTIENASEKVSKLRGVEYTWDHGKRKGQRDIGLIAQEVEEVIPEVVSEGELLDGTTAKRVDYAKLVGLLIESNKELQEEIKQLKERLDGFTK